MSLGRFIPATIDFEEELRELNKLEEYCLFINPFNENFIKNKDYNPSKDYEGIEEEFNSDYFLNLKK